MRKQIVVMLIFVFLAYFVMFLRTEEFQLIIMYLSVMGVYSRCTASLPYYLQKGIL